MNPHSTGTREPPELTGPEIHAVRYEEPALRREPVQDRSRQAAPEDAHAQLDDAVAAAYGWPADITDGTVLRKLLDWNRRSIT